MWGRIRSAVALIRSGSPVTSFQSNPLPSPVQRGIASATLLVIAATAARSEAEMSKTVSAWVLGTIKRCPSVTGLISVKASVLLSSNTRVDGICPSRIRQKIHYIARPPEMACLEIMNTDNSNAGGTLAHLIRFIKNRCWRETSGRQG